MNHLQRWVLHDIKHNPGRSRDEIVSDWFEPLDPRFEAGTPDEVRDAIDYLHRLKWIERDVLGYYYPDYMIIDAARKAAP